MLTNTHDLQKLTGCDYYDGRVIHSRFAYKFFREKICATGDIISFIAPAKVETDFMIDLEDILSKDFIYSDEMIHFCYELPTTNLWGGIAFQRLFNTTVGHILSSVINKPVEVEGDDIFVRDEFTSNGIVHTRGKASVSIVTEKSGAILGHTGVNIRAGASAPGFAYSTNMTPEQARDFQIKCNNVFYTMTKSIFTASTKVI